MKFCANNGQNMIAITKLLILFHHYHHIIGIVGITKDKKPSCTASWVDYRNHFLILWTGVQLIGNSKDLKWNIRV